MSFEVQHYGLVRVIPSGCWALPHDSPKYRHMVHNLNIFHQERLQWWEDASPYESINHLVWYRNRWWPLYSSGEPVLTNSWVMLATCKLELSDFGHLLWCYDLPSGTLLQFRCLTDIHIHQHSNMETIVKSRNIGSISSVLHSWL